MKKLSLVLVGIIGAAAVAQAVNSVNIVGVDTLTLKPGERVIAAAKFYSEGGDGTNTLIGVFGTNKLVQAGNYLNCDRVTVYDSSVSSYQSYAQFTDGHFYKCNNAAEWENTSLPIQDDVVLEPGGAFWLVHPEGEGTNEVSLLGEVLGGSTDTQDVAIVEGYQMVSYPYATEIAVQDLTPANATGAGNYLNADRIIVWQADTQTYQAYALFDDDGKWYKANNAAEWENTSLPPTDRVIGIGEGFWYVSQSGFTWSEGCPYSTAY